ncbi:hypothetical protein EDC01DRAFT_659439 [Geopyxis carbonaria]|nr:hypothetical protein EDC01DRAFT_659439 [Geopyxis carbonaria]
MQIPQPYDSSWAPYKNFYLPLLVTLLVLVLIDFAVSIIWVLTISHLSGIFSALIFNIISLLVVSYWLYLYFKALTNGLWTFIAFGISALWSAGTFAGNASWQTHCHNRCALHGFLTAVNAAHLLVLLLLTALAFRVWRAQKKGGVVGRGIV